MLPTGHSHSVCLWEKIIPAVRPVDGGRWPTAKKVCERDLRGKIHPPDYHHFSQSEVCIVYNFVHDSASTTQLTLLVARTLLAKNGGVYVTGDPRFCGGPCFVPQQFNLPNITDISLKNRHILALTKDNIVWSWGDNGRGRNDSNATDKGCQWRKNDTRHWSLVMAILKKVTRR